MSKLYCTLKINKILALILVSLSFPQYVEIDLGYNRSNGALDKYTDDGISIRLSYSNNIKDSNFFRWQGSFQFISFYSDKDQSCIPIGVGEDQECGPTIDITNTERGYTVQGGLRFTPEEGLFQNNSVFKPYAAFNIGAIYLQEKTEYSDPDANWFDNEEDYFTLDDIEDYRFNFIYSIEFGSNFNFKKWDGIGLDLGIRYNMCPSLDKTEQYVPENEPESFKKKIDADYYTVYLGVSIDLGRMQIKNEKTDKGKHI